GSGLKRFGQPQNAGCSRTANIGMKISGDRFDVPAVTWPTPTSVFCSVMTNVSAVAAEIFLAARRARFVVGTTRGARLHLTAAKSFRACLAEVPRVTTERILFSASRICFSVG